MGEQVGLVLLEPRARSGVLVSLLQLVSSEGLTRQPLGWGLRGAWQGLWVGP